MKNEIYNGMSIDYFDELCWAWNRHMLSEPWKTELRRDSHRKKQKQRVKRWLSKRFKEICKLRMRKS